jgi:hypothetical protein
MRRIGASRALVMSSTAAALAASLYWALLPSVHEEVTGGGPGPGSFHVERNLTLIESDGAHVIWALIIPVILTLIPLALGARKAASGLCCGALFVFVVLGSFSIGWLYLPAAALLLLAVSVTPRNPATTPDGQFPAPNLSEDPLT